MTRNKKMRTTYKILIICVFGILMFSIGILVADFVNAPPIPVADNPLINSDRAKTTVGAFLSARIQRNQLKSEEFLTDNAKEQYSQPGLTLIGTSNPYFAGFDIGRTEKLDSAQFKFKVRIYEEYTGEGIIGYFDETLIVIKSGDKYLIDSVDRGEYVNYKQR